jgi:Tol biopolymer transport system component
MTPDPFSTELLPVKRGFPWLTVLAVICVLLVAWLAWWKLLAQGEQSAMATVVVPLTSLPGAEHMGALSPDGGRVVFAWNGKEPGSAGFDLYFKTVGDGRYTRLTANPAIAVSAAWSPDGQQLAFARSSERDGGVFTMPANGGAARKIADASFALESLAQPAWSPDGKTLAYAAIEATGSQVLRLLTLEGLESRPLATVPGCWHAGAPVWLEQGRLAFICMTGKASYEVCLAEPDSGVAPRRLAKLAGLPQGLAWSKKRARLLVANHGGEGGGIWALELDGTLHRPEIDEHSLGAGLSAANGRVVYSKSRQTIDIWHVSVGPEVTRTRRWISSTLEQMEPQYSPDETRIAFQSNRAGSPEIWLADAAGTSPTRLTSIGGSLTGAPAWCADGRRLAFHSRASGASAIYIVDVSERVPRRIETTASNLEYPAWSADCQWLIAGDGGGMLYRIPASGGDAQRFTEQEAYLAVVTASGVVFNVADPGGQVLWMKPLAGGAEAPVPGMPRLSHADSWTADDAAIYFSMKIEGQFVVVRHDMATHMVRPLAILPYAPTTFGGLGLAASRDGKSLLYAHAEDTQSDLALISEEAAE